MRRGAPVGLAALAVAGLLLLAGVAAAEERRLLGAAEAAPYHAVGRLNIAGSRFCTATLIEPAVIVTAAHCLYHPRTGARVPLSEFRFVAGLRRGDVAALARPVRAVAHPLFVFGDPTPDSVGADLALLELEAPVAAGDATPFAVGPADAGPLAIVSYRRGRGQVATITDPCPQIAVTGTVLTLGCAVTYGISGAPVLAGRGATARVVAIVSAMGRGTDGRDVALTVLLDPALPALRAALAEEAPTP